MVVSLHLPHPLRGLGLAASIENLRSNPHSKVSDSSSRNPDDIPDSSTTDLDAFAGPSSATDPSPTRDPDVLPSDDVPQDVDPIRIVASYYSMMLVQATIGELSEIVSLMECRGVPPSAPGLEELYVLSAEYDRLLQALPQPSVTPSPSSPAPSASPAAPPQSSRARPSPRPSPIPQFGPRLPADRHFASQDRRHFRDEPGDRGYAGGRGRKPLSPDPLVDRHRRFHSVDFPPFQ